MYKYRLFKRIHGYRETMMVRTFMSSVPLRVGEMIGFGAIGKGFREEVSVVVHAADMGETHVFLCGSYEPDQAGHANAVEECIKSLGMTICPELSDK
jgi:hypothetical protein